MTPLLSPESFPGDWIDAKRAGVSWVGEAHFDGLLVVTSWERDDVAALLPSAWSMAPNVSETPTRHPVVFALGRQHRASVLFGGLALPSDADYGEVMVAVPFVRRRDEGRYLHTFIPRMYTADGRATWSGNAFYGFGKRPAVFDRLGQTRTVVDPTAGLILHATSAPLGPWRSAAAVDETPAGALLRAAFQRPIIGLRHDRTEVASYFEWTFDAASMRPVDAAVTLDSTLGEGLGPRTCDTVEAGALEVRGMRWRLSWPTPRRG